MWRLLTFSRARQSMTVEINILCRQMGYPSGKTIEKLNEIASLDILFKNPECAMMETDILDCAVNRIDDLYHSLQVIVICNSGKHINASTIFIHQLYTIQGSTFIQYRPVCMCNCNFKLPTDRPTDRPTDQIR